MQNDSRFGQLMFRSVDTSAAAGVIISTKRCKIVNVSMQNVAGQWDFYNQSDGAALVAGQLKYSTFAAAAVPVYAKCEGFFPKGCTIKGNIAGIVSVSYVEFSGQ